MPNLGEILRTNLPQDVMSQIEDVVGDDFDWDVVPRTRLNKVIAQRNKLAGKSSTNSQIDDGEGGVDLSGYVKKEDSDNLLAQQKKDLEKAHRGEVLNIRKQYAVLDKLRQMGAVDPQLILDSGLIKLDELNFDETNNLTGLEEQADPLKETRAYLFKAPDPVPSGTGKHEGGAGGEPSALDAQLNSVFKSMGVQINNTQEE